MVTPLPDNFLEELQDLEMELENTNVKSNCIKRLLEMYLIGISYYDAKQRLKKREFYYRKLIKLKDDPRTQEVLEKDYEENQRKKLESELVTPEEKIKIKEKILNRTTLDSKKKLSYISQLVKTVQHAAKKRDYLIKGQLNEMEILLGKRLLERKKQKKSMKKPEMVIKVIRPKKNMRKNKLFDRLKKNKKQNQQNSQKSLEEEQSKPSNISKMEKILQLEQEQLEIELAEEEERLQAELEKQLAFEQEKLAIELALEEKELQQEIENDERLKGDQIKRNDEIKETIPLEVKRKNKKKLGKLFNKLKNKKIKRKKQEELKQEHS